MAKKNPERGGILDLLSWAVGWNGDGENRLMVLSLDEIAMDRRQPRRYFDQESLTQLANSIRANGVIEPVLVRQLDGGGYQLIAGERRWRAARLAGHNEIPAVVCSLQRQSDVKKFQLIENLMRADLSPLEEVYAYLDLIGARLVAQDWSKHLLSADLSQRRVKLAEMLQKLSELSANSRQTKLTPEQNMLIDTLNGIFEEVGQLSWREFVSKRLPLINFPEEVLSALNEGWLSYQQARLLTKINARSFGAEKARQERQKLLVWIKRHEPTLSELRTRVAARRTSVQPPRTPTLSSRLSETARRLQAIKRQRGNEWPQKLQTRLERALNNLETLVTDLEKESPVKALTKNSTNGKKLK